MGPIKARALRIKRIRNVKKMWEEHFPIFGFRNHTTASHEFQLLDVLRDIRLLLGLILLALLLSQCTLRNRDIHVVIDGQGQVIREI